VSRFGAGSVSACSGRSRSAAWWRPRQLSSPSDRSCLRPSPPSPTIPWSCRTTLSPHPHRRPPRTPGARSFAARRGSWSARHSFSRHHSHGARAGDASTRASKGVGPPAFT